MEIKWGSVSWCETGDDFTAHTFAHTAVTLCVCESIIKALNRRDNVCPLLNISSRAHNGAGKWIHSQQGQKTYKAFKQYSVVFGKNFT